MVRAISLLHEQGFQATLRIVGVGPEETSLRNLVASHRLENSVDFVGAVEYDGMHREYQKADLYIQLSKVEGMSNSILEAMASGLPIITTDVGGVVDLIDGNGVVAIIVRRCCRFAYGDHVIALFLVYDSDVV